MLKLNKSRFAVLLEDNEPLVEMQKPPSQNDNSKYMKRNDSYYSSYRTKNLLIDRKKQLPKTHKQTIAEMTFPTLENSKINTSKNIDCEDSFINKLKTQNVHMLNNEDDIPVGWVKICRNTYTNHIQMLYCEADNCREQDSIIENEVSVTDVMSNLTELHKKRKNEYIEMWGIDDWEKEFMFKNLSYNYNDSDSETEYEYY